jgi:uncharacterized membrane protein
LVKDGVVPPDMSYGLFNGTFCREYFQNYVAFVTVDGPTSAVILTERDKGLYFYDVLSTLGGHFGLFAGMSLLSIAEVVILLITIFYELCNSIYKPFQSIQEKVEPNYNEKIHSMAGTIKVSKSDVKSNFTKRIHAYIFDIGHQKHE